MDCKDYQPLDSLILKAYRILTSFIKKQPALTEI